MPERVERIPRRDSHGEHGDLSPTVEDGLRVCGPDRLVGPLGCSQALEFGRRQPCLVESLATDGQPQPGEPALQCGVRPGRAVGVAEQYASRMLAGQTAGDGQGGAASVRYTTRLCLLLLDSATGKIQQPFSRSTCRASTPSASWGRHLVVLHKSRLVLVDWAGAGGCQPSDSAIGMAGTTEWTQ